MLLSLCIIGLMGCENNFQKLQSSYENGNYLEAVEFALEGLENTDLRDEIVGFLDKHGDDMITKLTHRGKRLIDDGFLKDAIYFHKSAIRLLRGLDDDKRIQIDSLESGLATLTAQKEEAIEEYVYYNYEKGIEAYKTKRYRTCVSHMEAAQTYTANFKKLSYYLSESRKKAFRHISITPLYKKNDPVNKALEDTITGILTGSKSQNSHKASLVLDGINVPDSFLRRIDGHMSRNSSDFIRFSIDDIDEDINNSHYYVEGFIDGSVHKERPSVEQTVTDTVQYSFKDGGETKWGSSFFHYDIFRVRYVATISIRANIYLTVTDDKVKSITFSRSADVTDRYRGDAYDLPPLAMTYDFPYGYKNMTSRSYLNQRGLVKNAIDKAAQEFTYQLLNEVDRDLDPYTLFLESEGLDP